MQLSNLIQQCMHEEIVETTGCTDPGVVAYAAAKAASLLQGKITKVTVTVSNNVYKNGVMVGIPGAGATGMELAAALGVLLRSNADRALSVLEGVTQENCAAAKELVSAGMVSVRPREDCHDPLYVHAVVCAGEARGEAVVAHDYDMLVQLIQDGRTIFSRAIPQDTGSLVDQLLGHKMEEIYRCIEATPAEEFAFLLDYAQVNQDSLEKAKAILPPEDRLPAEDGLPFPYSVIHKAREDTFCLAKARMVGLKLPVIAVTGSHYDRAFPLPL